MCAEFRIQSSKKDLVIAAMIVGDGNMGSWRTELSPLCLPNGGNHHPYIISQRQYSNSALNNADPHH